MSNHRLLFALGFSFVVLLLAVGCTTDATKEEPSAHSKDVHWGYEGDEGPSAWGELSPDYVLCAEGTRQSPIDIDTASATTTIFTGIEFNYQPTNLDIVNNGHTIQVNYGAGSTIEVDGAIYNLLQFHFHAPSEHTINGEHYELEMHLVHQRSDGALGVVGIMIESGGLNEQFAAIWENLPKESHTESHVENTTINAEQLLPTLRHYYRYDGSLTTPPCSEGVAWFVLQSPIELSASQISAFTSVINNNNRPVQPLNTRGMSASSLE